jgi:myo-inositol-1(or 4)-monophosphatase
LAAFYQRDLNEWDLAAGAFLATEAGARVEYGSEENDGLLLAAAPGVFDQLRRLVTK